MSERRVFAGRVIGGSKVLCCAALGVVFWTGADADKVVPGPVDPEETVRLHDGYGYVPHDAEAFDTLAANIARLPEQELAQMAVFAAALAADLDEYSTEELAGRIGDLLTVVDLAYADGRRTRPSEGGTGLIGKELIEF